MCLGSSHAQSKQLRAAELSKCGATQGKVLGNGLLAVVHTVTIRRR